MKKLFALPLAAVVALGACADFQGAVAPEDLNIGVSSPGTSVGVSWTMHGTPGDEIKESRGPGPDGTNQGPKNRANNNGWNGGVNPSNACGPDGEYWNNGGNSAGKWHTQCTNITELPGTPDITITFGAQANYVTPGSGNIHLNFTMCGYDEDEETNPVLVPCAEPTNVHYQRNQNRMNTKGVLTGLGSDGSEWIIDLGQINGETGNYFSGRSLTGLLAHKIVDGEIVATSALLTMSWE